MYATKSKTIELELEGVKYYVDIVLTGLASTESFSHGHGIQTDTFVETCEIEVETVLDEEGDVILNREIIKKVERNIDIDDYQDEEYEF